MNGGIVVKHIYDDEHFAASDGCMLAETMHPAREALPFGGYSIAHGYVEPHGRTAAHVLKNSAETYVVLSGVGTLHAGGEAVPLEFLCIVAPPWNADDEEIIERRP